MIDKVQMQSELLNPLESSAWNDLVDASEIGTIFHTSEWANVLSKTYGYSPYYNVMKIKGKVVGLLPLMSINNILYGKRMVCLPFSDHCSPIIMDADYNDEFIKHIGKLCKSLNSKYLEIRCERDIGKTINYFDQYIRHSIDLSTNEKNIFSKFRKGTKSSIKQAEKNGLVVVIGDSQCTIRQFYEMHCKTRQKHGLPPQPLGFFENLHKYLISFGKGFLSTALLNDQPVASAIFLTHRKNAVYKFSASDDKYKNLGATNLVLWEAIKHLLRNGCVSLCLGRTNPKNEGLIRFKRGWGTDESNIYYYRYNRGGASICQPMVRSKNYLAKKVFKSMPIPILKLCGKLLYRHMG